VFALEDLFENLKTVSDPEIPVNVVDLGLIYACEGQPLAEGHRVEIKMSMTEPGCAMRDVLREDAIARVQAVPGVTEVDVELAPDPDLMSEAARLKSSACCEKEKTVGAESVAQHHDHPSSHARGEHITMKVWIDQDLCTGDGLCEEIAPEVFTLLDDGLAYVKDGDKIFATAKGNPEGAEGTPSAPAAADSRSHDA